MKALSFVIAAGLACLNGYPASAQTVIAPLSRPDSASVTVPDLAFTPSKADIGNYDEYFYFHKQGVGYERAFADLDVCRIYSLQARLIPVPPKFIPLGSAPENAQSMLADKSVQANTLMMWGLAGALMADALIQEGEKDAANAANRRCLAYKGYGRYGTSRAISKQLGMGTDAEKLARMALIASGPEPQAKAIGP